MQGQTQKNIMEEARKGQTERKERTNGKNKRKSNKWAGRRKWQGRNKMVQKGIDDNRDKLTEKQKQKNEKD